MTALSYQLPFTSRHRLAQILDQDNIRGCDWRALVEQMGFTYEIILFLREKKSPTMALLEEWEMKEGSEATIDLLMEMVHEIDNIPALQVLKNVKEKMSVRLSPRLSLNSSRLSSSDQSSSLSSSSSSSVNNDLPEKSLFGKDIDTNNRSMDSPPSYTQINNGDVQNEQVKQFNQRFQDMVISDSALDPIANKVHNKELDDDITKSGSLSEMDRRLLEGNEFDVFLSFATADSMFAEEMRLRLEERAGISCYIPSEGLMPGQAFQDEIANKIKRGCRKTIIIMSPDYIDSPWCTYEARLAHHKSPDPGKHVLIPVMYVKCDVPDFIAYLYYLDYPRYKDDPNKCERYFWERLYKSIQLPQR